MTSRWVGALGIGLALACANPTVQLDKIAPGTPPALVAGGPGTAGCDPCPALLETPIGELPAGCAPAADAPCHEVDRLRNCIYARLGYDFDDATEWREAFAREPWYHPDPTFTWDRVTDVQRENAQALWDRVEHHRCAP